MGASGKSKRGGGGKWLYEPATLSVQLLTSWYKDTHELTQAMEWTLTLPVNESGSQNADKNIQVKNEASSKQTKEKAVLFSQHRNPKPAKILSPTTEQMQFLYMRTDTTDTANDPPPMEQSLD